MGLYYLVNLPNTEEFVMIEETESEEGKSSENEIKKFDKCYFHLLNILPGSNSTKNTYYIKNTKLYHSGFCSRLIHPPKLS
jgi:hypothetical protein